MEQEKHKTRSTAASPNGSPRSVFIVGAGRSGTTLLRLMLDAHSKVYSGPEDQLALVHLARWFRIDPSVERFVHEVFRFHTAGGPLSTIWGLHDSREEFLARLILAEKACQRASCLGLSGMFDVLQLMVLERMEPKATIWCIKTPHYALYPDVVRAVAPHAVVVHLVRDGRDVARSFLEGHLRSHIQPPTYARAAEYWRRCNAMARRAERQFQGNYTRIRYEDLVQSPRASITRLCSALGIELEDAMLEHEKRNRGLEKISVQERGWHEATAKPIDTSRVGRGERAMTVEDRAAFCVVAGGELRRYDYEPGVKGGVASTLATTVSLWVGRGKEGIKGLRTVLRWRRRFVRFAWRARR